MNGMLQNGHLIVLLAILLLKVLVCNNATRECPPCSIVGATVTVHHAVLLYFTFLSHLFPLPCGAGSTVPREGFYSSVIMPLSWCVVAVTLPLVSVHIQCQASIYTLSLCRAHSWRVRLAKQETLTPPGHLVSPLVLHGSVNVHRGALLLVPQ